MPRSRDYDRDVSRLVGDGLGRSGRGLRPDRRKPARRGSRGAVGRGGRRPEEGNAARADGPVARQGRHGAPRQEGRDARPSDGHAAAPARRDSRAASPRGSARPASPAPRASAAARRRASDALASRRMGGVVASAALLALGTLVGALLFLRPSVSELERRELTAFPELSAEGLLSGAFLSDLSLWYSDTFPFRDQLVGLSQALDALHGVEPQTQLVGGNVEADELPVEGETDASALADALTTDPEPVEVPTEEAMAAEIQNRIMQGLYVDGGAAYSIYYFSQSSMERYAQAMNTAAARLEGEADVYSIIVPNNSGVMLDEATLAELGGTDQRQAAQWLFSLYDEGVHAVPIHDALRAHNDEYLYFRTDHHWTQLGAYYAYLEYCRARGTEPADVMSWRLSRFEPFLGTFYSELGGNAEMAANPDVVEARQPTGTNDMTYWDADGNRYEGHVINDLSGWAENSLYSTFILGDWSLSQIENPRQKGGRSCLVVKDSFGCAFVPLLVDDYAATWVIDFRYSDRSIPDFVREHGIDDVIFLNNISLAGTDPVSSALLAQAQ